MSAAPAREDQVADQPEQPAQLSVAYATCPGGHRTGTQKRGGSLLRCGVCFQEGRTVFVSVPYRDGEQPPEPDPPAGGTGQATCRTCGASVAAPEGLPPGWAAVEIGADPERTKDGRPNRRIGPWYSDRCLSAGLRVAGRRSGIRTARLEPGRGDLARLMTRPPRGRTP